MRLVNHDPQAQETEPKKTVTSQINITLEEFKNNTVNCTFILIS